jgi:predicted XRE-type DNA-binding protein
MPSKSLPNPIEMQLIEALAQWIEHSELTEREAAWSLNTHQPTIHWILKRRRYGVSLTTLLELWNQTGGTWELKLTPPKK